MSAFHPKGPTTPPMPLSSPFFGYSPAVAVAPPPATTNLPEKGSLSFILNDEGRGGSTSVVYTANKNRGTTTAPARKRKKTIGQGQVDMPQLPMTTRGRVGWCGPERSNHHPKRQATKRSTKGGKGLVFHQVTFQIQPNGRSLAEDAVVGRCRHTSKQQS